MNDAGAVSPGGAWGGPGTPWSPGVAITFGWNAVRANPGIVGVLFVGTLVANSISFVGSLAGAFINFSGGDLTFDVLVQVGFEVINLPVACWMGMGMIRYSLNVVRGRPAQFGDIFSGGPFFTYLGTAILTTLGFLLGLVFCIVPGFYLAICWCFASWLVVDRGTDVVESMRRSWRMTEGRRLDLFLFSLLLIAVNLAGLLLCCVGLIVTSALSMIALAWTYQRFLETAPVAAEAPQS